MNLGCCWVQAMAQVGGLVMLQPEVGGSCDSFFFVGMDKVRFRKPVIAGDTLIMRMTLTKLQKHFGIAKMEWKAYVGGEVSSKGCLPLPGLKVENQHSHHGKLGMLDLHQLQSFKLLSVCDVDSVLDCPYKAQRVEEFASWVSLFAGCIGKVFSSP
ncbi:hypothetical protein RJ640_013516 [Escallonia rubra]|uniref:Uncharacterized protein n=1 Tax=Escallonia rubra TaxID=112253 RepID=A0AA88URQ2_9ASTE|nr:hypothetical protein RJ640_013516 [Escallonia rubra]